MQQIDIDFEVFKALTIRRNNEAHTYNEVLRELLELGTDSLEDRRHDAEQKKSDGRTLGGRFLPNGTKFRATYKEQLYEASIREGQLVSHDGVRHRSASAAARAITKNNVNGLTFWQVKRPTDGTWRKLFSLPKVSE